MSKPKIAFARTFFSKKFLKEIDIKSFDSDFDVAYNAIFLENYEVSQKRKCPKIQENLFEFCA